MSPATSLDVRVRAATPADLPELGAIAAAAIDGLLGPLLDAPRLAASRTIMGIDSALVDDGTYLVAEIGGVVAGCGGWSRRSTLYGGDHTPGRSDAWLDPRTDPTRIRAMYTAPGFARLGVGRRILAVAESAAAAAGFRRAELLATVAGVPLYEAAGYEPVEAVTEVVDGVGVPLVRMAKRISPRRPTGG